MAMLSRPRLLVLALWLLRVHSSRVSEEEAQQRRAALVNSSAGTCCCKKTACTKVSADGRIYSPDFGLCCKRRSGYCWMSGYREKAPSDDFCEEPQGAKFKMPEQQDTPTLPPADEGTPRHTVDKYCQLGPEEDEDQEATEEEADNVAERSSAQATARRNVVISDLVNELSKNSLDTMAKEMFSIYVCVRWVPNAEFASMAQNEIDTEQLPEQSNPYKLYAEREFIPLRCSRNENVYDMRRNPNVTHFKYFANSMLALADWLKQEESREIQLRIKEIQDLKESSLKEAAAVFDMAAFYKAKRKCASEEEAPMAHVRKASAQQLLENCAAAKWWLEKLENWANAFPFASFMSPDKSAAVHAPKADQQVLVCFGKRVASQLHRRQGGSHLLTDQSAVGCHGFWSFTEAANMLQRTVWLWRPPTCQLAKMELEMKLKLMELIADMNTQLFDAMPAMLLDEQGQLPDDKDMEPLKPKGSVGKAMKMGSAVAGSIAGAVGWLLGLNKAYQRLGLLLGNTVVKWSVCPLKKFADHQEEMTLDGVLGSEDDTARYYAEQAYSKWTLKANLLPGEACQPHQEFAPRCMECELGIMRQDMPEPYDNEQFVCPIRPLLPAKQQLKVFQEKTELCLMHMTHQQWVKLDNWMYRGRAPHLLQYNLTENKPTTNYEIIKIVGWRSAPDSELGLWRDFVTYGRGCTEEEFADTPDWCKPPTILEDPAAQGESTGIIAGSAAAAGQLIGAIKGEKPPMNKAQGERLINWAYGVGKKAGGGFSYFSGAAKRARARYSKLHSRSFAEVEAGELLHSASFQRMADESKSDSQGRRKLVRYSVACPCPGFDPAKEFRLKYTWAERGIRLLAKAQKLLPDSGSTAFSMPTVAAELQAASVLHMKNNENAWQFSYALVRTWEGEEVHVDQTSNVFFTDLVGADAASISDPTLYGLRATYMCGTRKAVYKVPTEPTGMASAGLTSFGQCVKDGAVKNVALRKEAPDRLYYPEETVVRVIFSKVAGPCYHEAFTKDANKPDHEPATGTDKKPKRIFKEAENSVYVKFKKLGSSCSAPDESTKEKLPSPLPNKMRGNDYRGLYLSTVLPPELLSEVLIQPEDIVLELVKW